MNTAVQLAYLAAIILFILGLKWMSSPNTARAGNLVSAIGMLLAMAATLVAAQVLSLRWIALGLFIGTLLGIAAARWVAMTAMPQMVALLNGCGGLASLLVAWEDYHRHRTPDAPTALSIALSILIGGVTFTGSVVAWAKLDERIPGRPILFHGQHPLNAALLLAAISTSLLFCLNPEPRYPALLALVLLSLLLGILTVIPIGGADMPVVISLLNSYSGMAACATGFVLANSVLIVTGSLVGASGLILTRIMCHAMNRSLPNVLFGGFGATTPSGPAGPDAASGDVKPISSADAYLLLEAARSVVIVPGYGLAVAQAQHAARELADALERNGTEVRYAIHPVAGRMPGHMNVLLAEANVPYDQLCEMDTINPLLPTVDVCLVVGANDVVNPAARESQSSPIYGMPIIEADRARTVIVLKRSLAPGFAGIENRLFVRPNTRMLFGDAKASLQALAAEFKAP